MKIGVITDIHNNVVALEAMLNLFEKNGCNEIICCGDIIGIGPYPEETIQRVKSLHNINCVLGNHDKYLVGGLSSPYPDGMEEGEVKHHLWEHEILSDSSKKFIHQLEYKLELVREGLKILVIHYSMNNNHDCVNYTPNPSLNDCNKMFDEYDADIIVYGHNHMSSFVQGKEKMYINCGSLGCPHKFAGEAKGGIITIVDGKAEFELLIANYDINQVLRKIDSIQYSDFEFIKHTFYGVEKT
ncbi:MAG TPA: YfcE family phosphodiesterase [Ruminiclostridium sp.]